MRCVWPGVRDICDLVERERPGVLRHDVKRATSRALLRAPTAVYSVASSVPWSSRSFTRSIAAPPGLRGRDLPFSRMALACQQPRWELQLVQLLLYPCDLIWATANPSDHGPSDEPG